MPGTPYTEVIRQQAVARTLDPHTTIAQVAREVGCSTDTIHRWLRQHRQQDALSPTVPQDNRPQGTYRPIADKMPHSQLPKDVPSVIVRKNPHTKTSPAALQNRATFIPVNIIDAHDVPGHSVEIVTPLGVVIRLTDASPQYIAELLTALASC